jgi:hypothetical protein
MRRSGYYAAEIHNSRLRPVTQAAPQAQEQPELERRASSERRTR